jgi:cysteine sulfinate desulfinase/cysteine desulfurase-like protein
VSRPLRQLEKDGTITLTRVASDDGYLDPDAIRQALRPETSLVALTHASNVLGTVQPIGAIAPIVREAGALLLVDAAQSAGIVPIDLESTPIDLLSFPGHKALYGPTGTGALYVGAPGEAPGLARGGDRRGLQERDPARRAAARPGRRHPERPGDRRPGRRARLGGRARGRGEPPP